MKVIRHFLLAVTACGFLASTGFAEWIRENPIDAPRAVRTVTPKTPRAYLFNQARAEATAEFFLNEEGRPIDIAVVAASSTEYTDAVVNALRDWRFEPAGPDAPWTGVRYRLTFVFKPSGA